MFDTLNKNKPQITQIFLVIHNTIAINRFVLIEMDQQLDENLMEKVSDCNSDIACTKLMALDWLLI